MKIPIFESHRSYLKIAEFDLNLKRLLISIHLASFLDTRFWIFANLQLYPAAKNSDIELNQMLFCRFIQNFPKPLKFLL